MTPTRLPIQVSCPNCQQGNLPGSPYCSRCGAPLPEEGPVTVATAAPVNSQHVEDALKIFMSEGQDPLLVRQSYDRACAILTSGEIVEFVAIAARVSLAHAPDCVVVTDKRLMLYRKKMLGKYELDDWQWRDVREATVREGKGGVTLSLIAIQGWRLTIDALPKAQAWRICELAAEHNEHLRASIYESQAAMQQGVESIPVTAAQASAATPSVTAAATVEPASFVSNSHAVPNSIQAPVSQNGAVSPQVDMHAPAPANLLSTPESVLQSILQQQQDNLNGGAPTRPMQFAAAAFQAPAVTDAQQVTIRDTDTEPQMRPVPSLPTLEQIAVFSGPLAFNQPSANNGAPLSQYPLHTSGALSPSYITNSLEGTLQSNPRLTSGSLPAFPASGSGPLANLARASQPLHQAQLAVPAPVDQAPQVHDPMASDPIEEEVFGALSRAAWGTDMPLTNSQQPVEDALDLHVTSSAVYELGEPPDLADVINYMMPAAADLAGDGLPVPGSMLSASPLLSASPADLLELPDDDGGMETQRLYLDPDADTPTDINLSHYDVGGQRSSRSTKSTVPPAGKGSASRSQAGPGSSRAGLAKASEDPVSKMKQLKMLLDSGFITEVDYEAKKADILARFF